MIAEFAMAMAILLFLLFIGAPLIFCFGGALMYISLCANPVGMAGMFLWGFEQLLNPALLCISLFVFAGGLMSQSGMADSLLNLFQILLGRFHGSLGLAAILSCAFIGAISGSGMTGIAAAGPLLIPRMASQGYDRAYATVLLANASVLGLLIPPSISMIVYGWATGTSILACFLSTLMPAILLILIFCLCNWLYSRKKSIPLVPKKPQKIPAAVFASLPAMLLPVIILGGIYGGIMTPTESAAIAVAYAIPAGLFLYRGLDRQKIVQAATDSATSVGSIMALILVALLLGQQFVLAGLPQEMADFLLDFSQNKIIILLLVNAFLILAGMILNDVTGILLLAPLLLPLVRETGIHPVHFAAIIGVNLSMGTLTPPFAGILYFSMGIGQVEFARIIKPLTILLCAGYLPMCFLVTFFEPLSMWLPHLFGLV